ncbi:LCP family protein [Catenulispora yoronensis]
MAGERNAEPAPWERAARQSDDAWYAGRQGGQPASGYSDAYEFDDAPARSRGAARGAARRCPARAAQAAQAVRADRAVPGPRRSGPDRRTGRPRRTHRARRVDTGRTERVAGAAGVIGVSAASLVLTVIGTGAFTYQHFNGSINTFSDTGLADNRPAEAQVNAQGQRPENILLVGSDSRDNGNNAFGGGKTGDGARSDTSILLHVYADHQHAVGISIPRDMMVQIPSCQLDPNNKAKGHTGVQTSQFNAAFAVGNTPQGNVACEINTIEAMSGIRVDHTIVVGFSAFAKLTDDIGGVQVCVPKDVNNVNGDHISLKKGIQVVRGQTALDYVREREGLGDGSDIGRTRRQQAFLGSMIKKMESDGVLNDPTTLSSIFNDALKYATFDKDLGTLNDLMNFASSMKGINPAHIQFMTLPGHYRTQDGRVDMDKAAAQVIWDHLKSDTLLDGSDAAGNAGTATPTTAPAAPSSAAPTTQAPPAPSISPATISVRVLNSTTAQGLATDATTSLQAQGYNAVVSHTVPAHSTVTTIVYATAKQEAAARQLATLFPGAKVEGGGRGTQLVLTLGDDYATSHPKPGSVSSSGSGTASGSPSGGSTPGAPLPSDIAANSRTADQDICSGITNGY